MSARDFGSFFIVVKYEDPTITGRRSLEASKSGNRPRLPEYRKYQRVAVTHAYNKQPVSHAASVTVVLCHKVLRNMFPFFLSNALHTSHGINNMSLRLNAYVL